MSVENLTRIDEWDGMAVFEYGIADSLLRLLSRSFISHFPSNPPSRASVEARDGQ